MTILDFYILKDGKDQKSGSLRLDGDALVPEPLESILLQNVLHSPVQHPGTGKEVTQEQAAEFLEALPWTYHGAYLRAVPREEGNGQKDLSAMNSMSGGALVPPVKQGELEKVIRPPRLKALHKFKVGQTLHASERLFNPFRGLEHNTREEFVSAGASVRVISIIANGMLEVERSDGKRSHQAPGRFREWGVKHLTKGKGEPCKQGETSKTGCIPASGEGHAQPQEASPAQEAKPRTPKKAKRPKSVREQTLNELISVGGRIAAKLGSTIVDRSQRLVAKIPEPLKVPLINTFHIVEGAMMVGNKATKALALETARKMGASDEEAEKLGRAMSSIDLTLQLSAGNALLVAGQLIPAKIASIVPFASGGYLLYQAARHPVKAPIAMLQAVVSLLKSEFPKTVKGATSFLWGAVRHPLTPHGHHEEHHEEEHKSLHPRIKALNSSDPRQAKLAEVILKRIVRGGDWWWALFSAALDEVRDPLKAIGMADRVFEKKPVLVAPGGSKSLSRPLPPSLKAFTGKRTDKLGRERCYQGGKQVPCPDGGEARVLDKVPATTRPGPSTGKPAATRGEMIGARRLGAGEGARVELAGGKLAPPHIKPAMVAPDWTDVRVALDPDAEVLVKARDSKGRLKTVYSDSFHMKTAALKFARIFEGLSKQAELSAGIQKGREDPRTKEEADCLFLIEQQGTRPGSDADRGGTVKAYGAITLEGQHVIVDERGDVSLQFVGKEGVWHDHRITDPRLAEMLKARKKGDSDRVFNTDETKVIQFSRSLDGGAFTPKDFRTMLGTRMAYNELAGHKYPRSEKEFKEMVRAVATVVSHKLGNKPAQAVESYIAPEVWSPRRRFIDA